LLKSTSNRFYLASARKIQKISTKNKFFKYRASLAKQLNDIFWLKAMCFINWDILSQSDLQKAA
jgi:hypothetical protein